MELGNEFYMNNGSPTALAEPYLTDFFNTGNNGGINIPDELYSLNNNGSNSNYVQQVQAAIQTAFNNYINFLECSNQMTGSNGQQVFDYGGNNNGYCPVPLYSS